MTKSSKVPFSVSSAGATANVRWVGGTASGAPTTGTFVVGDYVVAQNGVVWVCTAGGTPGTWTNTGSSGTAANVVVSTLGTAHKETVSASAPSSPSVNDIWIDTSAVGAGLTAADIAAGTFQTGAFSMDRLRLTATPDITLSSTLHAFQVGADAAANLAIDSNEVQARSNGAASSLYLNSSGGNVVVGLVGATSFSVNASTSIFGDGTTSPVVRLNGPVGGSRVIDFQSAGLNRWRLFGASSAAESGSNAGSNFILRAIADDGTTTVIDALSIVRSTGAITAGASLNTTGNLSENGNRVYSSGNANLAAAVTSETAFGQAAAVGAGTDYARGNHTHGTPSDPNTTATTRQFARLFLMGAR